MTKGKFIIFERDGFQCFYCGSTPRLDGVRLSVDHIVPVDDGGSDRACNLVACCENCNSQKGARRLAEVESLLDIVRKRNSLHGIDDEQIVDLGGTSAQKRSEQAWKVLETMVATLLRHMEQSPHFDHERVWQIYALALKAIPEYKRFTNDHAGAAIAYGVLSRMVQESMDPTGFFSKTFGEGFNQEMLEWFMSGRHGVWTRT